MSFSRTPSGLAEKWRFYQVPTVWVEGPTDVFFYWPITEELECRVEAMRGKANAEALIAGLVAHNYPYLVVLDGDYQILRSSARRHRRVVVLARYSFENYLWEAEAVNGACLRHAQCGEQKDLVTQSLSRMAAVLKKDLQPLVALDIAARRSPAPPTVLPDAFEQLSANSTSVTVDPSKVAAIIKRVQPQISAKDRNGATKELRTFLRARPITHILKGHMVLGILRKVFLRAAERESGSSSSMSNDAFTQILSEVVWKRCPSEDHKILRRAIQLKVRRLRAHYQPQSKPPQRKTK